MLIMTEMLPFVSPARSLGDALAERARLAAVSDHWPTAVDSFRLCARLGDAIAVQPSTICMLVGADIQTKALTEARHLLNEYGLSSETAAQISDIVSDLIDVPGERAVEINHLDTRDALQWTHGAGGYALPLVTLFDSVVTSGGLVGMTPVDPENDERTLMRAAIARWYLATHAENIALADRWHDGLASRAARPFPSRWDDWPPAELSAAIKDPRHAVLAYFLAKIERAVDEQDVLDLQRGATLIMTAIERYTARHQQPPDTLRKLTPGFLDTLPNDPLSGEPFGYRRLDDDPHNRAYVLYSLGPDRVDDGALPEQPPSTIELIFRPEDVDIVLNPPRREGLGR
ncbi:MAG: hypothetical protein SYC29_14455 [Planctomycetota bacterium]|nr:hypothetical protein [Planctomycetota bacterium]